jgi:hypothetical protein
MAQTYLVPVDFSPPSEVGLDYALKLAKEEKSSCHFASRHSVGEG